MINYNIKQILQPVVLVLGASQDVLLLEWEEKTSLQSFHNTDILTYVSENDVLV